MKSYVLILLLLVSTCRVALFAQVNRLDSLKHELKREQVKAKKVILMYELAKECLDFSANDAIVFGNQGVKLLGNTKSDTISGELYRVLGEAYFYMDDFQQALYCYTKTMECAIQIRNRDKIVASFNNLGLVYRYTADYERALEYYEQALQMKLEMGDTLGTAVELNNIGVIYEENLKRYSKALEYYQQAIKMAYVSKDYSGVATYWNNIADVYRKWKKSKNSVPYYFKALEIADSIGFAPVKRDIYKGLYLASVDQQDYVNALRYHELLLDVNDSLFRTEKNKLSTEIKTKYANQAKERQIVFLNKEKQTQGLIIWVISGAICVLLVLFIIIIVQSKNKSKSNALLEHYKKNIVDSMQYAQRIQQAILPPAEQVQALLGAHFVMHWAKDIVSGDFFWLAQKDDSVIFVVADSTGHGIPGGFMSMLGAAYLGELTQNRGELVAGVVLDGLREKVKQTLHQTGKAKERKDGMDMSLGILNTKTRMLQYAGAHHSIFIVRDGAKGEIVVMNELHAKERMKTFVEGEDLLVQVKGDRQPIGISAKEIPFTTVTMQLREKDKVYLFTDGYPDQMGGKTRTKYLLRNFRRDILLHNRLPMAEQKERLVENFSYWKGACPQTDDVLVLGFVV